MSPVRQNARAVAAAAERQRALIIDMLIGDPFVWRYIAEQADELWPQLPDSIERDLFADLANIGRRLADLGDQAQGQATAS